MLRFQQVIHGLLTVLRGAVERENARIGQFDHVIIKYGAHGGMEWECREYRELIIIHVFPGCLTPCEITYFPACKFFLNVLARKSGPSWLQPGG